jgi:hypothetical protein
MRLTLSIGLLCVVESFFRKAAVRSVESSATPGRD